MKPPYLCDTEKVLAHLGKLHGLRVRVAGEDLAEDDPLFFRGDLAFKSKKYPPEAVALSTAKRCQRLWVADGPTSFQDSRKGKTARSRPALVGRKSEPPVP